MKLVIPKGATSRIITVFIQDSSLTTGAGLGSLTEASSIVGGYVREGATGVALAVNENVTTEGTYQAPSTAGQVRIGTPANMRAGTYELHFHNDLWATGAEACTITLGGASNMADIAIEVQLSDPVRGLGAPTALPNAAADAAGGLVISDAGGLDIDAALATLTANRAEPGQGAPAASTTMPAKVDYLFKAFRNKVTQTSDTYSLFADDDTTVDQKATVSDNGTTFTRTKIATGA